MYSLPLLCISVSVFVSISLYVFFSGCDKKEKPPLSRAVVFSAKELESRCADKKEEGTAKIIPKRKKRNPRRGNDNKQGALEKMQRGEGFWSSLLHHVSPSLL